MKTGLHRTSWIAIVAAHVDMWKASRNWSRETVAEAIVSKYCEIYPYGLPGVEEFSNHSDVFTRHTTNATRIFRWLDDCTKDKNLLSANFLPVILQAMPVELRLRCFNEMLRPMYMVTNQLHNVDQAGDEKKSIDHLKLVLKEGAEACTAMTNLIDGETPDELAAAQHELIELIGSANGALAFVNAKLVAINVTPINQRR